MVGHRFLFVALAFLAIACFFGGAVGPPSADASATNDYTSLNAIARDTAPAPVVDELGESPDTGPEVPDAQLLENNDAIASGSCGPGGCSIQSNTVNAREGAVIRLWRLRPRFCRRC